MDLSLFTGFFQSAGVAFEQRHLLRRTMREQLCSQLREHREALQGLCALKHDGVRVSLY